MTEIPRSAAAPRRRTDRDRFTAVYEACHPRILAYVRRRVDAGAAEDLAAEVFVRAWRGRSGCPEGPPDEGPVPWLYGIARNVVLEHYRSRDRASEAVRSAVDLAARESRDLGSGTAGDATAAVDLRLDVAGALARLSPADQEVLTLHAWEGLGPREIAAVLGIAPGTARVQLHRARTRLDAALTRPEGEEPAP